MGNGRQATPWLRGALYIVSLIALLLPGGCGPGTTIPAPPTATAIPVSTPTATPAPTPTPEPGITQTRPIDGMVLVYVPAGDFRMGSSDADLVQVLQSCPDCQRAWFTDEQPAHEVQLTAFQIDRTEVTNAQFATFLSHRGNQVEGGVPWLDLEISAVEQAGALFQAEAGHEDHPVVGVSWYGAAAYCRWAGGRLPSEAEWAYAARGPAGAIYPWGDEFVCDGGNFAGESTGCDDGYATTAPVGAFPAGASWCRALDMGGNVWEWVGDRYGADYYSQAPERDPRGPERGECRVLRGGAWNVGGWAGRGAHRSWNLPTDRSALVGFRCMVEGR